MKIKNIKLRNFRNYSNLYVEFNPNINIIVGNNAQGKTNLLESILYLSTTRSHRVNQDQIMIKENEKFANIECELISTINKKIQIVIHENGKSLFVQGKQILKSSEFIGIINAVLFSPRDIDIFEDSPRIRRKLMDIEIGKINKQYMISLNNYSKLLKDRNNLLKNNSSDKVLFESIEKQMIDNQITIINFRRKFISVINQIINNYYQKLSCTNDVVKVNYECCIEKEEVLEIINEFKSKYDKNFERDLFLKSTSFGIHRDDLTFKLNDKDVSSFASQGQRRMVILAFKLSLIDYIKSLINDYPILLLDDVLSELDDTRKNKLFEVIPSNIQTIITTTNLINNLDNLNYKVIKILDGRLMED